VARNLAEAARWAYRTACRYRVRLRGDSGTTSDQLFRI